MRTDQWLHWLVVFHRALFWAPLLCFILLNDFDTDIGSNIISFGLKFADDKHVFRGVNGTVGRDNLQFDLDTVYL